MAAPGNDGIVDLDLALRPYELMGAWRRETRSLLLVVREPVEKRQRIQARINLLGLGVAATITGRARAARPHPVGVELELEPDDTRLRALERLVEIACGERVAPYRQRAPRLLASVPAVIFGREGPTYMATFSVSTNGCGLAWTGSLPDIGAPMDIRLGAGSQFASFCGEVCWIAPSTRAPTVGLQFAAGDRRAWAKILADLQRAGAPPA
jgi:hypothetical protein